MNLCPFQDQLLHLLAEELPLAERSVLETHVEQCTLCQQTLERLTEDSLVQTVSKDHSAGQPALLHLCGGSPEQMPSSSNGAPAEPSAAATDEDLLGLLSPSSEPGSLGRLGDYEVMGVVGRGGMGVVWQGFDPRLRRKVAIKVLAPHLVRNPSARERFLREAQAAAAVTHEHLVTIHHVGEQGGTPYLVMPLLEGETLCERLRKERLPLAEVLRIGRETAEGLAAAHAQKLVHRDVKPANVWLEGSGAKVKVLDFGLVRRVEDAALTQEGMLVGTPAYVSPEQASGGAVDERADLFGLGVMVYEMCTGRTPFQGQALLEVLAAIASHTPPPPSTLRRGAAGPGRADRPAVEQDTRGPPRVAREVAEALRAIAMEEESRPRRWRRRVRMALAGALVGGLAVIGWSVWPSQSVSLPSPPGAVVEGLSGELTVRVWAKGLKKGLRVQEPGALPVGNGEHLTLEVRLNQPAFVYLLWLDSEGGITPLHPWNPGGDIEVERLTAPPRTTACQVLHAPRPLPNGVPSGYKMEGRSGLETLLLLARRTPVPMDVNLAERLGQLLPAPYETDREVVVRGLDRGGPAATLRSVPAAGPTAGGDR